MPLNLVPLLHLRVSVNSSHCCQYVQKPQLLKQCASTAVTNFLYNLNPWVPVFIFCYVRSFWYLLEKLRPLQIMTATKTSIVDWVNNGYKWRKFSLNFEFIAAAWHSQESCHFSHLCLFLWNIAAHSCFLHMQYKTPQFPYWNLKVWNIMWDQFLKNQTSQKLDKQSLFY